MIPVAACLSRKNGGDLKNGCTLHQGKTAARAKLELKTPQFLPTQEVSLKSTLWIAKFFQLQNAVMWKQLEVIGISHWISTGEDLK